MNTEKKSLNIQKQMLLVIFSLILIGKKFDDEIISMKYIQISLSLSLLLFLLIIKKNK